MVQALSPFLVVHANAAYSRLTGLDAHEVVGKSVDFLLALPESASDEIWRQAHGDSDHERQTSQDAPATQGEHARSERQRKDSTRFETLERLIVSCGFGHIQFINAIAVNKHQMVGRNVTFLSQFNATTENHAEKDEESKPASVPRNGVVENQLIPCRTAIAPIVSSQSPAETSAQTDQDLKRLKHHHSSAADPTNSKSNTPKDHRRHHQPQVITHYIIQLERLATNGVKQLGVDDSISSNSTSVEARLMGISKAVLVQQKAAVDFPSESPIGHPGALGDDEASGSTASRQEAMVAIG